MNTNRTHRTLLHLCLQESSAILTNSYHHAQKGNVLEARSTSTQVFIGFWLLYTLIISIFYSSSLTSFLISPGMQKPISSLEELVDQDDITWGRVSAQSRIAMLIDT